MLNILTIVYRFIYTKKNNKKQNLIFRIKGSPFVFFFFFIHFSMQPSNTLQIYKDLQTIKKKKKRKTFPQLNHNRRRKRHLDSLELFAILLHSGVSQVA